MALSYHYCTRYEVIAMIDLTSPSSGCILSFMSLQENVEQHKRFNIPILRTILAYRRYASGFDLPQLYCNIENDHLPLVPRVDYDDNVYLYCVTCNYEKRIGQNTADELQQMVDWRDVNLTAPQFDKGLVL